MVDRKSLHLKCSLTFSLKEKKINSSRWRDRWDARMLGWSLMSADVRSNICPSKVLLQNTNPQTSYRYAVTTASLIITIFLSSYFRNGLILNPYNITESEKRDRKEQSIMSEHFKVAQSIYCYGNALNSSETQVWLCEVLFSTSLFS